MKSIEYRVRMKKAIEDDEYVKWMLWANIIKLRETDTI
jgi:hypothetical protein